MRTKQEIIDGLEAWSRDERLGDGMLLREAAAALRAAPPAPAPELVSLVQKWQKAQHEAIVQGTAAACVESGFMDLTLMHWKPPAAPTPAPTGDDIEAARGYLIHALRSGEVGAIKAAARVLGHVCPRCGVPSSACDAYCADCARPVGETPAPRKSDLPCVCGHEYDDHFHGPSHNGAPYCNECHCGQYVAVRTITRRGETPADRKEPTS